MSVHVHTGQKCVYIASDGGRVCRPLVIADNGVSRVKGHHMEELRGGYRTFDDFLREGLVEYLDVNEENNSLVSASGPLWEGVPVQCGLMVVFPRSLRPLFSLPANLFMFSCQSIDAHF